MAGAFPLIQIRKFVRTNFFAWDTYRCSCRERLEAPANLALLDAISGHTVRDDNSNQTDGAVEADIADKLSDRGMGLRSKRIAGVSVFGGLPCCTQNSDMVAGQFGIIISR